MFKKRNYRKKVVPSKKRVIRKALEKRSNMKISKVVKNVLAKQVETKCIQLASTYFPRCINSTTVNINDNNICLTPISNFFTNTSGVIIGQGVGQSDRIGAEITMKAAYLSYQITPMPYNLSLNAIPKPTVVRLYFYTPKVGQNQGPDIGRYISGSANCDWFENTGNVDSGLVGNLTDLNRKIDTDNYRVLGIRTHKIGYSTTNGNTGALTTSYGFSNNDFKFMANGRFKITSPKKIAFDRQTYPKIQPVYCMVQVLNADNTINAAANTPIQMSWNLTCYFTDL